MGMQMFASMLVLLGPMTECPAKTSSSECTGTEGCAWTESRSPKCGVSQAHSDMSSSAIADPAMKVRQRDPALST